MPHHITGNQCCLCVPLLLRTGIRILPLLPPYLRPRVGTGEAAPSAGGAPAQLGSVGVWGGCSGDASLVPSWDGIAVSDGWLLPHPWPLKLWWWESLVIDVLLVLPKLCRMWKIPASNETLSSSHWLPVFCLPKMRDHEITREEV